VKESNILRLAFLFLYGLGLWNFDSMHPYFGLGVMASACIILTLLVIIVILAADTEVELGYFSLFVFGAAFVNVASLAAYSFGSYSLVGVIYGVLTFFVVMIILAVLAIVTAIFSIFLICSGKSGDPTMPDFPFGFTS
jgi:hypothetical protein